MNLIDCQTLTQLDKLNLSTSPGILHSLSKLACSLSLPLYPSYWIIQIVAIGFTALILPGLKVTNVLGPILLVLFLTITNAVVWDISLFMAIPTTISEQALLLMLWNGAIFWILVKLLPGIEVKGIVAPILAPLIFSISTSIAGQYATNIDWNNLIKETSETIQENKENFQQNFQKQNPSNPD